MSWICKALLVIALILLGINAAKIAVALTATIIISPNHISIATSMSPLIIISIIVSAIAIVACSSD